MKLTRRRKPITFEWLCRFMEIDPVTGCWLWTRHRDKDGYGTTRENYKTMRVHRKVWQLLNGPIPKGKQILHSCDRPPCFNPDHLICGTDLQNVNDCVLKDRHLHGCRNAMAKLTPDQVKSIREDRRRSSLVAKDYGIERSTVWNVRTKRHYAHFL